VAAEFCDESAAHLEGTGNSGDDQLGLGNPMQCSVGKDGVRIRCRKLRTARRRLHNAALEICCELRRSFRGTGPRPTTSALLAAISVESWPVPHPRSRIRSPFCGASHSSRPRAFSQTKACFAS
jgi:hypothetical protein